MNHSKFSTQNQPHQSEPCLSSIGVHQTNNGIRAGIFFPSPPSPSSIFNLSSSPLELFFGLPQTLSDSSFKMAAEHLKDHSSLAQPNTPALQATFLLNFMHIKFWNFQVLEKNHEN